MSLEQFTSGPVSKDGTIAYAQVTPAPVGGGPSGGVDDRAVLPPGGTEIPLRPKGLAPLVFDGGALPFGRVAVGRGRSNRVLVSRRRR